MEAEDFLYKPKNRVWMKSFFQRSTKTKKKTLVANPTFLASISGDLVEHRLRGSNSR